LAVEKVLFIPKGFRVCLHPCHPAIHGLFCPAFWNDPAIAIFKKFFLKNACEKFHDDAISSPFRRLPGVELDGTGVFTAFVNVQCD